MDKFLRTLKVSSSKSSILSYFVFSLAVIFTMCGCSKKEIVQPVVNTSAITAPVTPIQTNSVVTYTTTYNTHLTLSKYTYQSSDHSFIAKVLKPNKNWNLTVSAVDSKNVVIRNDSLFLTSTGLNDITGDGFIDFNIQYQDTLKYNKPFRVAFDLFSKNKVIAHRGAWKTMNLPHNSIASLKRAIAIGCQASEFDVHLTSDKVLVVCHDDTWGKYTIETSTYAQLAILKLSNGETLPKLKEYIAEAMKQTTSTLDLEIKMSGISISRGIETTDSVVALVHQMRAQAWVNYTSMAYNYLLEIIKLDPSAITKYLGTPFSASQLKKDGIYAADYDYNLFVNTPTLLADCKKSGVAAHSWTINDKPTMIWWKNSNGDGIVTDEPELALEVFH